MLPSFDGAPEMLPSFDGAPEMLPSLDGAPEMLPARAAEEIDKVKSDAQRIDWKRFIFVSPGNRAFTGTVR
jgi:hypothetical protein